MDPNYLLMAAPLFLAGVLWCEATQRIRLGLALKGLLSSMFVLAALCALHPLPAYYHLILAGLLLGLVGDLCLALPSQTAFRVGLIAFLAGHLLYVAAFAVLVEMRQWLDWPLAGIVVAAGVVMNWLRPRVGKMFWPVAAYILAISLMLAGACAVWARAGLASPAGEMILLGSLAFYLSDLLVARNRFVQRRFINRLLGLPLYYSGQFLLAFSVGWVG